MKKSICLKAILIGAAALSLSVFAFGQDAVPETQQPAVKKPQDMRTTVLAQLGLSREQIQQIRRVNVETKPLMDPAQKRLRNANRMLDEAIYSDQMNETEVQNRLKEQQSAQADVAKIRFMHEFAVRRILTSDQLVRFRELRRQFEQTRVNNLKNNPPAAGRPLNRQNPVNAKPLGEVKQQLRQNNGRNQQRP